jgi:hypothetical protein
MLWTTIFSLNQGTNLNAMKEIIGFKHTDAVCFESVRKQKKQLKHDLNSAALFQLRY